MDIVKHSMGGVGVGGGADHSNSNSSSKNNNNNKLYKGVRLRKWGKWVSEIRFPNSRERIWLGSYDSAEKAARAFDAALYCLRGPHASFNFHNTPFDLDINLPPQSLTPQQILQIAQTFANKKHHINHLPTHENSQQQQQEQQPSLLTCTSATATSSSTQSSMNNIDWTFLNVLDDQSSNAVAVGSSSSDDHYGLFSNLDNIHSGDFMYSTPFYEEQIEADIDIIDDDNDPFSHQYSSFLWSWDF